MLIFFEERDARSCFCFNNCGNIVEVKRALQLRVKVVII